MPKTTYLETNLLNHILRNTPYATPGSVYLALYTVAPGVGGGGAEVTGGGYVRQAVTFSAPVGGQVTNTSDVIFPVAQADWGTLVAFGVFDTNPAGNLLYFANLNASRSILIGDQLKFAEGQILVSES